MGQLLGIGEVWCGGDDGGALGDNGRVMDFLGARCAWRGFCASVLNFLPLWAMDVEGFVEMGARGTFSASSRVGSSCIFVGESRDWFGFSIGANSSYIYTRNKCWVRYLLVLQWIVMVK